ncbi:General substrate transporter [Reticulomyxa filosa]|uniref:General substrate transporter n=1 Tax=Reticulomyxa filosa TaxID=46433 RepID=X6NJ93_RETFI|nr:General substrate transporter [Reticulomyxa filosa]|eukprot:ETO26076.1 General substrate transporter [Reticulomyxa filosa]
MLTLMTMGTAVFIVGVSNLSFCCCCLIPPKKYLSYFSTFLYFLVRTLMALSYGGEFTIAITYLSNITASPSKVAYRRGVLISALLVFMLGRQLATIAYYASETYSNSQQFKDWVWRMSFLASALLTLPGLFLRRSLPEDKIYAQLRSAGEIMEKPFSYAITNYRRELAVIVIAFSACIVTWKVTVEWYPKFIHGNDEDVYADNVNIGVNICMAFGFLVQGFLSDEHGMFTVMIRSFVLGFLIFAILPVIMGFLHVSWILSMLQSTKHCFQLWLSSLLSFVQYQCVLACNWFEYATGHYCGFLIALYVGVCILVARLILLYSQQYPFEQRDVEMIYLQVNNNNPDDNQEQPIQREDTYERSSLRDRGV